MAIYKH
ncbi:unnamed protein product, partial [Onchocerca ochengi]